MALIRATFELSEGNVPFVVHAAEDTGPHSHVANNIPQKWLGLHFDQPTFDHMSADRHATDQELGVGRKRGGLVFELHREIEQERFVGEVREVIYERFLEKEVFGPGPPGFSPIGSQVVGRLLENPGWFEIGVDLLRKRPLINGQPIVGRAFDLWANTSLNYRAGNGFNGSNGTFGYDNFDWEPYDW
ncbi:MAG: hypothetical protein R3B74_12355 [Nitrospirales bacterium]|nr:hypothetical protein [Nitrospirales bacterium]